MAEYDTPASILHGQTILSFEKVRETIVVLTETHRVVMDCEGDCCASAYFTDLEIASDFPAKVLDWVEDDAKNINDENDDESHVVDATFVKVKTDKGYIDFTMHVSHNGYYGGWYKVSELYPHVCPTCASALHAQALGAQYRCTGCAHVFTQTELGKIADSLHRLS